MNLAERVTSLLEKDDDVEGLVLIGSRVRAQGDAIWRADENSDWDFQILTSNPGKFTNANWTKELGTELHTYAVRSTAIGRVPKIAAIFAEGEADFVIINTRTLRLGRWLLAGGFHRRLPRLNRSLQDLALIIRPGWKYLKDSSNWNSFYEKLVAEISDRRLSNPECVALADAFVCDYLWTLRKIERGEFLASQRMLHHALLETNLRLLHESKLRTKQATFPEARRAEFVMTAEELSALTISTLPDPASLHAAAEKCANSCRMLMHSLVASQWTWPTLPTGHGAPPVSH
ncbi:MAG: hypothetical protein ABIZ04_20555 [Opitutus sp.]